MKPFNEIDHSGDIGIEVRGADIESLLSNAARGLFGLLARNRVGRAVSRRVTVRSESYEDLLVDWLSELISCAASHGEVYGDVSVEALGPYFIEATLYGEPVDAVKHDLRFEVKAATYHSLRLEKIREGYFARVIFDL